MKKTQFIELLATIKKTMVSFISITFFVLLGVGIFLGIDWSVTGFKNTIHNTLDGWNMHDVSLFFPYGFTNEEIKKIEQLDYIDTVEGQNSFEASFMFDNYRYQAKVILLTNKIDDAHKIIGNIPTAKGEIGFERHWAENNGVNVGDIVVFKHDDDGTAHNLYNLLNEDLDALQENTKTKDGMKYLTTDTFKVTGLFENATYVNQYKVTYGVSQTTSIPNDCITYVSEESIDPKAFNGYNTLLLTSNELKGLNTFDDEYKKKNNEIVDRLKEDVKGYVEETNNKLFNAISNIRDDINLQIKDGEQEIIDAEKEIVDAEKVISDGEKKISDGKIELADAKIKLDEAEKELSEGWNKYKEGLYEYNEAEKALNDLQDACDRLIKAIDIYEKLKNVPASIDTFFDNYIIIDSIAKTILNELETESAQKIKQFFLDYKNGVYDDNVIGLAKAIKDIVNADGFSELKEKLQNVESPDTSVTVLLQIIDYLESVADGIEDTLKIYEILKNSNIINILESKILDIPEEQIIKLKNALNYIKEHIDDIHGDVEKYEIILNAILSMFEGNIEEAKIKLETEIKPKIATYKTVLEETKLLLNIAYVKLKDGQKQYEDGLIAYEDGLKELKDNEETLLKAKRDLTDGKKELENGKEDLEIAKNKVKDFDSKVEEIEHYEITSLGRNLNASIGSTIIPIEIMSSVKYTMVLLFVIVGMFVCYSALSRNVYDQTIQIGTKKALGLSKKDITISFLLYGSFATLIGSILGIAFARYAVEPVILKSLVKNYITADTKCYFSLSSSIAFILFELLVTNLTSYFACNKVLKRRAITLLQGPENLTGKPHFYEKLPGWNSLSLLTKTIINNCVNDKRRVLSTLVGVAGCCSLMVCAISIVTNMNDSIDCQLNNITKIDSLAYYDSNVDGAIDNIGSALDDMEVEYFTTSYSSFMIENTNGDYFTGVIFIYDDDKFLDFFDLTKDGIRQEAGDGLCLSKAYAQYNNIEIGDYVTYLDGAGEKHNIEVTNIFDYYLLRIQAVMTKEAYIKEIGEVPIKNSLLIKRGNYTNDEINNKLYPIDGFISVSDYVNDSKALYSTLSNPMWIIVCTFFVSAIVLAFLVLLNLLTMFVEEKKKELIVMMINGYSRKKVKTYIYGDTIVLTIVGVIIGIVIGITVGFATIKTFDSDCVTIMRNFNIPSYVICGVLTSLLAAVSCLIALKKIDKFKLTEINSK